MKTTLRSGHVVSHGYVPNPEHTEAMIARYMPRCGHALSAMADGDDNGDRYNYRVLVACLQAAGIAKWLVEDKSYTRLNCYNQGNTSSCTGNGRSMAAGIEAAHRIVCDGEPEEFLAMPAPEVQYAFGLEIENNLGSPGFGCSGSSLVEASEKFGVGYELSAEGFDISRGNADGEDIPAWEKRVIAFGTKGVPTPLRTFAADHKSENHALVDQTELAWSTIGSGYAFLVCSNVSYDGARNEEGIIRATGHQWPHAMCVSSRRTSPKYGRLFLIHQSWTPSWTTGPYWLDQPVSSFWVVEEDLAPMLNCRWSRWKTIRDSWVSTGLRGFTRRGDVLPDWVRDPRGAVASGSLLLGVR